MTRSLLWFVLAVTLLGVPSWADPAVSLRSADPVALAPASLLDQGIAAYAGGAYDKAVALLERYQTTAPGDWRGMMKLCQACHAAGLHQRAEQVAHALRTLWSDNPSLAAFDTFLREQFTLNDRRVCVYEAFDASAVGHRYEFVLTNAAGKPLRTYYVNAADGTLHRNDPTGDVRLQSRLSAHAAYNDLRGTVAAILARENP